MKTTFSAEIWAYDGPGGWHFVSLPPELAAQIKAVVPRGLTGFGSVPASVRVGSVTWTTSIFPDTKRDTYLLPVKAAVRKQLRAVVGTTLEFEIQLGL